MNGATEPGAQGVCPAGWHIPTDPEFKELEFQLGMAANALDSSGFRGPNIGGKLKEVGFFSWLDPNLGGINSDGFRAIPGGFRNPDGTYVGFGTAFNIWSSESISANQAWSRVLSNESHKIGRLGPEKDVGLAVRCVKDQDVVAPLVSNLDLPNTYPVGSANIEASVNIDDDVELVRASFHAKRADQEEWNIVDLPLSDQGEYAVNLTQGQVGEIGLQYFFSGEDAAGNWATTDTVIITYQYIAENSPVIPNLQAGGKATDWRMFSIPHNLVDKRISTIFEGKLGAYNKQGWRLLHYDNNFSETKFQEYQEGLVTIESGKGYWFNYLAGTDLRIGTSTAPKYSIESPAIIQLNAGWNQIGNPYVIDILWQDVLDANGLTSEELEPLRVYNGGSGIEDETVLNKFSGAYVHSDQARLIGIPVKVHVGGRYASSEQFYEGWLAKLNLEAGNAGNSLSGFGMHPEARNEHDGLDRIRVPRFGSYIDVSFVHLEYISPNFGRDIVAEKEAYTWEFEAETNVGDGLRTISWNITGTEEIDNLLLYDVRSGNIIDMLQVGAYSFENDSKRKFKVFFGDQQYLINELPAGAVSLGENYPNPFTGKTNIPYAIYGNEVQYSYAIKLFALDGSLVTTLAAETKPAGSYQLEWDGRDVNGKKLSGLYIYSLEVNTPNGVKYLRKKLIVQ